MAMRSAAMKKTTKAQFGLFRSEVLLWVERLGLVGWRLDFFHEDVEARARCDWERYDHVAALTLSTKWSYVPTDDDVRFCAQHEALELLLADMQEMARGRSLDALALQKEAHRIIYALQNAFRAQEDG